MIHFLHCTVGAYNFVAVAIPRVDLLLVIEFTDFAQSMNIFYASVDFETANTGCIRL